VENLSQNKQRYASYHDHNLPPHHTPTKYKISINIPAKMENAETNSSSNNQAQDHEQALSDYGDSEGFEFSSMGLVKRKNFVGIDEAANTNSHRTFYFRNTSGESLIDFCSSILKSKPI